MDPTCTRFCLGAAIAMTCCGAAKAEPTGQIVFLGRTEDMSRSVWLSRVDAGQFFVFFSETGVRYDEWTQAAEGLHLSISDEVREYGGTHSLYVHIEDEYSSYDNYLDSANQRPGGFVFPQLPELPPTGITPTVPPLRPQPETLTPEVRPDPDTLTPALRPVPETLTPEVRPSPDTLTPALRPVPETLTPEVRPDPDTLTPALRPVPETLTPEVRPDPDTLTPALRPVPETLTPEVRPDPDTLTPALRPVPETLTPEVRPDPDTLTPALRPVPETLTPEVRPHPVLVPGSPARTGQSYPLSVFQFCDDVRRGRFRGVDPVLARKNCDLADVARSRWTIWGEGTATRQDNHRYASHSEVSTWRATVGADYRANSLTVVGLAIDTTESDHESFQGALRQRARSVSLRPYVVRRLKTHLMLDASLGVSFGENRQDILVFSGKQETSGLSASAGLSVLGGWRGLSVYSRAFVAYSHARFEDFTMAGTLAGETLRVRREGGEQGYGVAGFTIEFSHSFTNAAGWTLTPFAELGARYAFDRPDEGEPLRATSQPAKTQPWAASVRLGARAWVSPRVMITASAAHNSLGVDSLSTWEGRLYLSRRF